MSIEKVTLQEKLNQFSDYWNPRIVGELNNQLVKLAKFKGEFVWHQHEHEDEMFMVLKGSFYMHFRDKIIEIQENDFIIVPRGTEHKPVAAEEVHVLLFEPASTLNTGNVINEFTKENLQKV